MFKKTETKPIKKQLESIFLMNVAIYFKTYREVFRFIQINHKCFDVVDNMKINPSFNCSASLDSFFKRFQTETVDGMHIFTHLGDRHFNAYFIKNCPFIVKKEDSEEKKQKLINLFPKIQQLDLYHSSLTIFPEIAVEHAIEFDHLDYISGEYSMILEFMKNYTKNGTEMYCRFPKTYYVHSIDEKAISLNPYTAMKIDELLKYIRCNEDVRIIFQFLEYPDESDIRVQLVEQLSKKIEMKFLTFNYKKEKCFNNTYYNTKSKLIIPDISCVSNNMNEMISENYFSSIQCGIWQGFENIFLQNEWNVPECVEKMRLQFIEGDYDTCKNLTTNHLKSLKIVASSYLSFDISDFPLLKNLIVRNCNHIYFNSKKYLESKSNRLQNKQFISHLEMVKITGCQTCEFCFYSKQLKTLYLKQLQQVKIIGDLSSCQTIAIVNAEDCKFAIPTFEGKSIFIENVDEKCQFINEEMLQVSPLKYLSIKLSKIPKLLKKGLYLPDGSIKPPKDDIFVMRKFLNTHERIETVNNMFKKKVELDKINVPFFSDNFFNKISAYGKKMKLIVKGKEKTIPAIIRYFEMTMNGFNVISIGFVHQQHYKRNKYHIGWGTNSIGYHSVDGHLYKSSGVGTEYFEPFGLNESEVHTVGCGYDSTKREVFFTCDGKKAPSIPCEWIDIAVAFTVRDFEWIDINYGEREFVFDLLSYMNN